jgi:hypothetical protein
MEFQSGSLRPFSSEFAPHGFLLLAAVAAGVVAQGAYYASGRLLVAGLVLTALVVALMATRGGRAGTAAHPAHPAQPAQPAQPAPGSWPVLAASAALGLWALARAVPAGGMDLALAAALTVGCLAVATVVLHRTGPADRERLVVAVVWLGALTAVLAWAGVAWRAHRLAVLVEHRVWRGGATITYPNAVAAMLAMLAMLAVALLVARRRSVHLTVAGYLLLVGLGATLSRAGIIALLAGLAVLAAMAGIVATVARVVPLALGSLIALAALAPSFPAADPPRPMVALLGLATGAPSPSACPRCAAGGSGPSWSWPSSAPARPWRARPVRRPCARCSTAGGPPDPTGAAWVRAAPRT